MSQVIYFPPFQKSFKVFSRKDIYRICSTMAGVMTTKAFVFCTLISQLFLALVLAGKSKYVRQAESFLFMSTTPAAALLKSRPLNPESSTLTIIRSLPLSPKRLYIHIIMLLPMQINFCSHKYILYPKHFCNPTCHFRWQSWP